MKTEEQISKLGLEELMAIAQGGAETEPEGLAGRTEALIDALAEAEEILGSDSLPERVLDAHAGQALQPPRRAWVSKVSAIAACAALLLSVAFAWEQRPPKDTFDDPMLARAELQEAFEKIGDHVRHCGGLVAENSGKLARPIEIVREAMSSMTDHKDTTQK